MASSLPNKPPMATNDPESNVPPEERTPARRRCICVMFIAFLVLLVAAAILLAIYGSKKPVYYSAISAASPTPPGEFTLALGVESGSPFSSECFEPGMAAEVVVSGSGGNMIVARGNVTDMACAPRWRPMEMVTTYVVAMGGGDGGALAAIADSGKGFDLLLRIPDGGSSKDVVCRGRRIGDPLAPCDAPKKN